MYYGDYYRGDYYKGDYYRGDPFLGGLIGIGASLVGKLFKKKAPALVAKALPAVTTGFRTIGAGATGAAVGSALTQLPPIPLPGGGIVRPKPGIRGTIERVLPGGRTGYIVVGRRRMNPANPKALRRALRRVSGFGKLASRAKRDVRRAAASLDALPRRGRMTARATTVRATSR